MSSENNVLESSLDKSSSSRLFVAVHRWISRWTVGIWVSLRFLKVVVLNRKFWTGWISRLAFSLRVQRRTSPNSCLMLSTKFVNSWVTLQVVSKLSKGQVPFNITPHPLTRSVKCPNKKLCKHCKCTSTWIGQPLGLKGRKTRLPPPFSYLTSRCRWALWNWVISPLYK